MKLNENSPLEAWQTKDDQPQKRCSDCLSLLDKGLPHSCKKFQLRENLKQFAAEDKTAAEQFASQVIATKDETPGGSIKISQPN